MLEPVEEADERVCCCTIDWLEDLLEFEVRALLDGCPLPVTAEL